MKTLTLALALVAGAAAAQPASMNCRSSATPCGAAFFSSNSPTPPIAAFLAHVANGQSVLANNTGNWRIGMSNADNLMFFTVASATAFNIDGASGLYDFLLNWPIRSNASSGSDAYKVVNTGAWWHVGAGTNDRFKSDGTNVLFDTSVLPVTDTSQDLGGSSNTWQRVWLDKGLVLAKGGNTKWSTAPISTNASSSTAVLFNVDAQEPLYASQARQYNPLGQAQEWVVQKRWLVSDIGIENANCPLAATALRGTGAGVVAYSCTDAAAASQNTLSGETYRVLNTTAVANAVSIVDVNGNMTELQFGPKYLQRVSIPSGSTANARIWVALVPTATSLSGVDTGALTVVGFRFSTAVPDTNWQACSGTGAAVTCVDTGIAPTTGTNITLEVDCREATKCRFLINGSLVASQVTSGNLPGQTSQLAPRALITTLNTTAKALWYGRSSVQTN